MSAPYIIPFNHMPASSGLHTTGAYTVPAGKYARISIGNTILPVLNSVNMYSSKTTGGDNSIAPTANSINPIGIASNSVHKVTIAFTGLQPKWGFGPINRDGTASGFHGFATTPYVFGSPTDVNGMWFYTTSTLAYPTSITIDSYTGPTEIWLKAGDVLSYLAGSLFYEEYDVIS